MTETPNGLLLSICSVLTLRNTCGKQTSTNNDPAKLAKIPDHLIYNSLLTLCLLLISSLESLCYIPMFGEYIAEEIHHVPYRSQHIHGHYTSLGHGQQSEKFTDPSWL